MRKYFILYISIILFSFFGCQKDLRNDLDDLIERVSKLEKICEQANTDIIDLKQIVSLLEANDFITSVNELADKSGYAINFLKGNTIVIKHGTNGDYPVVGVDEYEGVFYWTQKVGNNPTSWMLDKNRNKIPTTGVNGKTPVIAVNSAGYWTVDYGEGAQELLVNGKPVLAKGKDGVDGKDGINGTDGKDGVDGKDGYSPFESVIDKGDYIELKLVTGTILKLPKENSNTMKIVFNVNNDQLMIPDIMFYDESATVTYNIENPDPDASIYFEATNGWMVEHNENSKSITLIPSEAWSEEGRIIVSVLKDDKLISQFRYSINTILLNRSLARKYIKSDQYPLELIGGVIPVTNHVTFPPKWFNKNVVITITPVLRNEGGEERGPSYIYQGEYVKGANKVISWNDGCKVDISSKFPYIPVMKKSELFLTFKVEIKERTIYLEDVKINDGVVATIDKICNEVNLSFSS